MAEHFGVLFYNAPWIFGMEQQELPQKIETERIYSNTSKNRTKILFTYTFYGDGYLKTCTGRYSYTDGSNEPLNYTTVYEYFWQ